MAKDSKTPNDGLPSDEKLAELHVRRIKPGEFNGVLEEWNGKFKEQGKKPPVLLLFNPPEVGFDTEPMQAYTHHQKGKPSYTLLTPDVLTKMNPAERNFVENHEAAHVFRNHKEGDLRGVVLQIDALAAQEGFPVALSPGTAIPAALQLKQESQADLDAARKVCDTDVGINAIRTFAAANGVDLQSSDSDVVLLNNRIAQLQNERGQVGALCKPSSRRSK